MNKAIKDHNRAIMVIFAVLSLVFIIIVVALTAGHDKGTDEDLRSFSEGWQDASGNVYDIEDIRADETGVAPTVSRKLPDDLTDEDSLCFESYNINLDVMIDEEPVYSFKTKENLTGKGSGTVFHEIGLSKSMAGRTVRIYFERCNLKLQTKRGQIETMYIGPSVHFVHMVVRNNLPAIIASGLVFFFGIVFLLIGFVISDNERLPFDVGALGLSAIICGAWLLVLTNVFQLISDHIYTVRVLNRFLVLMTGVPLICFFNSLTKKKRRIYPLIEFWSNVFVIFLLIVLRYAADVDMMWSFQRVLIVYLAEIVILTVMMFVENERLCRENGVPTGLKYYYIGITVFIVCAFADYILYYVKRLFGSAYGTITSIGTFILIPVVLIQFIRWWAKDRQVVERERFTNSALQYALSSDSPDESIRLMLEFMGREFGCKRVIVFEDAGNGRFNGRYAWFDNSLEKRPVDLLYIPYKGAVDAMVNAYRANGNSYIINDVESYRDINPNVYNILRTNNVENLVASPIESDGEVTGVLLLLDMSSHITEEAASVAALTSYFLSQLILRRDEQKRMRMYTYNDSLSGAQNRRAYDEFVKSGLDLSSPFGYMVCSVDGLEEISDKGGFEAGDAVIADTVVLMGEVFGKENVYRMAGSRFAAFGFETDETYFRDDVSRFERNAKDKGISVSTGSVYCINGAMDLNTVSKRACEMIKS